MIAVTFALPSESSAFIRLLQNPARGAAGSHTISGTLHGRAVCVLHTGVGERTTRERLAHFLREQTPQLLISSGFAGALSEQLRVGDIFVDENSSDAELARRCALPLARLATVSDVLESDAARRQLALQTGADAVDMETEWIAELCRGAGVPLLSLRVISDSTAEPLPAPARFLFDIDHQRTPFFKLALYVVRHPVAVISLIKFAKRIAGARDQLADALSKVCAM